MEQIILEYLIHTYHPHTIILYGSFQNHSYTSESDFDALLLTEQSTIRYDHNIIEGILLDIWIRTDADFKDVMDYSQYVQIYDGNIVKDDYGLGQLLKKYVREYVERHSVIDAQEKLHLKELSYKMLKHTYKQDTEGLYHWHWLLQDSLELYCKIRDHFYFGPKKTLLWIKQNDPTGYSLAKEALCKLDRNDLGTWIDYIFRPLETFNLILE